MFAEFELEIHALAEAGGVLTGEALGATYLKLLRDYMGHDRGVMRGYDTDSGAIVWEHDLKVKLYSSPVLVGDWITYPPPARSKPRLRPVRTRQFRPASCRPTSST